MPNFKLEVMFTADFCAWITVLQLLFFLLESVVIKLMVLLCALAAIYDFLQVYI